MNTASIRRRAIGDTGNEQHAIRTVPRFGYRWIGELVIEAAPSLEETVALGPAATEAAVPAPTAMKQPRRMRWRLAFAACIATAR